MLNGIVLSVALGTWDIPFPPWIGWQLREFASWLQKGLVCNCWWFIGDIRLAENNHQLLLWTPPKVAHDCDLALLEAPSTAHGIIPLLYIVAGNLVLCWPFFIQKFRSDPDLPFHIVIYHYIIAYPFCLTYLLNLHMMWSSMVHKHAVTSTHASELHKCILISCNDPMQRNSTQCSIMQHFHAFSKSDQNWLDFAHSCVL